MGRRKNNIEADLLKGSTPLQGVETFEQAFHLFLREGRVRNLSDYTLKYYKSELFNVCKMLERLERQGKETISSKITNHNKFF